MNHGEVDAGLSHLQSRLKNSAKSTAVLPKLPKWSSLTSFEKKNLLLRSALFIVAGWAVMGYVATRPPGTNLFSS